MQSLNTVTRQKRKEDNEVFDQIRGEHGNLLVKVLRSKEVRRYLEVHLCCSTSSHDWPHTSPVTEVKL